MVKCMHPTNDGAGGQEGGKGPFTLGASFRAGGPFRLEDAGPEPKRATPKVTREDVDRVLGKPHTPSELLRVAKGWLAGKGERDNLETIADGSRLYAAVAIVCEREANNPEADKRLVDELAHVRFSLLYGVLTSSEGRLYGSAGNDLIMPLILPGVERLLRSEDSGERARALEIVTDEFALAEIAIKHEKRYPEDIRVAALEKLSARMDELGLAGLLAVAAYSKDEKAVGAAKERIYGLMTGDERKAGRATEAFFSLFFRSLCREGMDFLHTVYPVYSAILAERGLVRGKTAEQIAMTQWGQFLFEMDRFIHHDGRACVL